jgi:hypothetical protein
MEGYCSTGQSPQWAVVPVEEEEEEEEDGRIILRWIFRKWNLEGIDWIDLAQGTVR